MPKPSRITSKQRIRQSLGESRRFVEGYFGRGSASVKVTFNARTANRAHNNDLKAAKKKNEFVNYRYTSAAVLFTIGTKGAKNVMFLQRRYSDFPDLYIHEHAHAAYFRVRRRKGKRSTKLVSEMLSSTIQLEWLHKKDSARYLNVMNICKKYYDLLVDGSLVHDGTLPSKQYTVSIIGLALAYKIFTKFPDNVGTRRRLIKKLMGKEFTTSKQALNWIEKYPIPKK